MQEAQGEEDQRQAFPEGAGVGEGEGRQVGNFGHGHSGSVAGCGRAAVIAGDAVDVPGADIADDTAENESDYR